MWEHPSRKLQSSTLPAWVLYCTSSSVSVLAREQHVCKNTGGLRTLRAQKSQDTWLELKLDLWCAFTPFLERFRGTGLAVNLARTGKMQRQLEMQTSFPHLVSTTNMHVEALLVIVIIIVI